MKTADATTVTRCYAAIVTVSLWLAPIDSWKLSTIARRAEKGLVDVCRFPWRQLFDERERERMRAHDVWRSLVDALDR